MSSWIPWAAAGVCVAALGIVAVYARLALSAERGSDRMRMISDAIRGGAMTFIKREYRYVAVFAALMVVLIAVALRSQNGWMTALCYILGTLFSLGAGFLGLYVSTRVNDRTAQAASNGPGSALKVAFHSGAVMGLAVAGLGLLGLTICYLIFEVGLGLYNAASIILGFSLGASSVALFARVGGGIFTKATDVGSQLVASSGEELPADELQNPSMVAENVGDNVGEVAGMGADLYESFVAAIVAPIAIAASGVIFQKLGSRGLVLPLAIAAAGIIASVLGTLFVRAKEGADGRAVQRALTLPTYGAAALSTVASFFLVWGIIGWKNIGMFWPLLMGVLAGCVIALTSEYFTSAHYKPVERVAESAGLGPAIAIIRGLSFGMLSVIAPVVIVVIAIAISFFTGNRVIHGGGGIYAIGLAALGMLSTTGMIVSVDAAGPVGDNAFAIAELSGLDTEAVEVTSNLNAVGNTTSAIAKGFAIGSAALAALALFAAYAQATGFTKADVTGDYKFLVGLFLGALVPFVFSGLALNAVVRAASALLEEVKRQFREIPGLQAGEEGVEADHARCVDVTTKVAVYEMLVPGALAIAAPLLVGVLLGSGSLAGFLAGAVATGFILATMMSNTGGAWANARKLIEGGALGGKGSRAHAGALIADTVGDPLKDTSGPSINILIKVMAIVSLIFVPLFIK